MPFDRPKNAAKRGAMPAIATQTALEAMRKLVKNEATNTKADPGFNSYG